MRKKLNKKIEVEKPTRNILIFLTLVNLVIAYLNITYQVYQNADHIDLLNNILKYTNTWICWIDNLLLYIFAFLYIILAMDSKKERIVKISFAILTIVTALFSIMFIVNFTAGIFGIY